MIEIEYTLPAAASDALLANVDSETGFLTWSAEVEVPWTKGFDVDSLLIFDCDHEYTIRNIDLLIPVDYWVKTGDWSEAIRWPPRGSQFKLRCAEAVVEQRSHLLPVRAETSGSLARVVLTNSEPMGRLVRLSPSSAAQISDGTLIALYARLQ